MTVDANLHCLIYNLLITIVRFSLHILLSVNSKISVEDLLNTKGLVALTEYQQMGWRLIKVENCDNLPETYIAKSDFTFQWNLLFYKHFNFEKPLTGSIKIINNKKKDWFSHKTWLVFVHGDVFRDGSQNPASFKMELFAIW